MNLRFVEWIWHVRGRLPLGAHQSDADVFDALDPLFRQRGTTFERDGATLTFRKKDQAAQDKMSIFDSGTLRVERGPEGPTLRYHLVSRALLFCFFMPLLFLGVAQLTTILFAKPSSAAAAKAHDKAKEQKPPIALNPIDKALGAPEPEKPKKDGKPGGRDKRPTPTAAYVFAALFAILYVLGRIGEDWLIRRQFRKHLVRGQTLVDATADAMSR